MAILYSWFLKQILAGLLNYLNPAEAGSKSSIKCWVKEKENKLQPSMFSATKGSGILTRWGKFRKTCLNFGKPQITDNIGKQNIYAVKIFFGDSSSMVLIFIVGEFDE